MAEIPDVAPGGDVESIWGNALRDRALMRYASEATRNASEPSPAEGTLAYLADQNVITYWDGTIWAVVVDEVAADALPFLPLAGGTLSGLLIANGGIQPGVWQIPTLQNGWVDFGGSFQVARYRISSTGFVEIQGMIDDGSIVADSVIFTLDAGYRPAADLIMSVRNQEGNGRITIRANGQVQISTGPTTPGIWTSLAMIFSVG